MLTFLSRRMLCHLHLALLVQVEREIIQHCEDKLILLYTDYIRTEPGKAIGRDKHQDVLDFYKGKIELDDLLNE